MNRMIVLLSLSLTIGPGWGQTVYKCPQPDGTLKFQQAPCAGEGEKVQIKVKQPTEEGLRESERAMLDVYANQRETEEKERQRQEAVTIERAKATATEAQAAAQRESAEAARRQADAAAEQAAAQRATARAIWLHR